MSFNITNRPTEPKSLKQKTLDYGKTGLGLGIIAGIAEGSYRKSWLNNGKPSDTFEKQVITNLEKTLPDDDYKELKKIQQFFYDVTDPDVTLDSLKEQIYGCGELKEAVQTQGNETKEQAIERIFSEKDTKKVKENLTNLQEHTKLDKTCNKTKAKNLIKSNFNTDKKALEKAADTSEELFKVLKKSKMHVKFKTAFTDTLVAAFIGGVGGMLIGASSKDKK